MPQRYYIFLKHKNILGLFFADDVFFVVFDKFLIQ